MQTQAWQPSSKLHLLSVVRVQKPQREGAKPAGWRSHGEDTLAGSQRATPPVTEAILGWGRGVTTGTRGHRAGCQKTHLAEHRVTCGPARRRADGMGGWLCDSGTRDRVRGCGGSPTSSGRREVPGRLSRAQALCGERLRKASGPEPGTGGQSREGTASPPDWAGLTDPGQDGLFTPR